MALNFNLGSVSSTEFGVGYEEDGDEKFSLIPVDTSVQDALKEMAEDTWDSMGGDEDPDEYQPSEKYGSQEYIYIRFCLARRLPRVSLRRNVTTQATAM